VGFQSYLNTLYWLRLYLPLGKNILLLNRDTHVLSRLSPFNSSIWASFTTHLNPLSSILIPDLFQWHRFFLSRFLEKDFPRPDLHSSLLPPFSFWGPPCLFPALVSSDAAFCLQVAQLLSAQGWAPLVLATFLSGLSLSFTSFILAVHLIISKT
jgi:hypothetical protein